MRGDDGEHTHKDEAGHPANEEHGEEPHHAARQEAAAGGDEGGGGGKEFIDNSEPDALDEEITQYWSEPAFVKLLEDTDFLKEVHDACEAVIGRFKPSPVYTCDDLEQDVIARFGKWFPKYRWEARPKSLLRNIALNQLIDVSRKRDNQCDSYEEIARQCHELSRCHAAPNHNHTAAKQERAVLMKELTRRLTRRERMLFKNYFVRGMTTSEIAELRGVSRQVVAKQLARITKKLKSVVDMPSSPVSDPVTVGIGNSRTT
jgi:RNA polymerase sigma factor (sigma-70 family)